MIFLDTNVVSGMMKRQYEPEIAAFVTSHPLHTLFLPSIVIAEIRLGIQMLPAGRRRLEIEQNFSAFLQTGFSARVVAFDEKSANAYAVVRTTRTRAGRPVQAEDGFIGAMALAHGATLATRNTSDFDGYGLTLVNPWLP